MGVRVIVEYDTADDALRALDIQMWLKNNLPVGLAYPSIAEGFVIAVERAEQ
jgi:hypothetical protein